MLNPQNMLPASLSLLLLPLAIALSASPAPFSVTDSNDFCNRINSVTYNDMWGPIFTEHHYTCNFPASRHSRAAQEKQAPLTAPAPYSHVAGQRGADPMIVSLSSGDDESEPESQHTAFTRALQQSLQKITIPHYDCALYPSGARLDENRYSNLFWALRQLTNQTCLEPGEAKEYGDIPRDWTADWRFLVVNRGSRKRCEWWQEIANVAEALHFVCYFSELGVGFGERNGGVEAVAWGAEDAEDGKEGEGGLRWCLRYSDRGWGVGVWEEKCLGV